MVALTALVPAPPITLRPRIGRLLASATVIDNGDPHVGFGATYERDIRVTGTATWPGPCATPGANKTATESSGIVTATPFTVFQMTKCRMIGTWDNLSDRLGVLFEAGEERTLEEAFATALAAGTYGTVSAGPAATNASPTATFAIAEQYLADRGLGYGNIVASPEVITYAVRNNLIIVEGDRLFTYQGTPVIGLVGAGDVLYAIGPIVIWRGSRIIAPPAQNSPYDNEFVVLTERVYAVAAEGDDGMGFVKWTVDMAVT